MSQVDDDSDDDSDDETNDIDEVPDLVDSRGDDKDPPYHIPGKPKNDLVDHHQAFLGDVGAIARLIKGLEVIKC